ncbi:MAG: hypothetical protein ABII74_02745 [Elusimicrobiota bacterium]
MTELSRSAGIPARITTIDANEGITGMSYFQITEVYTTGWQAVDAYNNNGPMSRSQLGSIAIYSEERNDIITTADSDWNSGEVGDWW